MYKYMQNCQGNVTVTWQFIVEKKVNSVNLRKNVKTYLGVDAAGTVLSEAWHLHTDHIQ